MVYILQQPLPSFHVPADAWRADVTVSKCRVAGLGEEGRCPVELAVSPASMPSLAGEETVNTNTVSGINNTTSGFR